MDKSIEATREKPNMTLYPLDLQGKGHLWDLMHDIEINNIHAGTQECDDVMSNSRLLRVHCLCLFQTKKKKSPQNFPFEKQVQDAL